MISVLFVNTVTVLFYVAFDKLIKENISLYSKVMLLVAAYCTAYYISCIIMVIS